MERRRAMLEANRSFRGAGLKARAWAVARLANAPLADLDAELLHLSGRVLSVGCGFGVVERYAALRNARITIDGFEFEKARVAAAAATHAAAPRVTVQQADVTQLHVQGAFDAALAMDVFHHLDRSEQHRLASALATVVRPGGEILVKDIATTPRWQHAVNAVHDRLAVGERTHCYSPRAMSELLAGAGLRVDGWRRLGRLSPYPHYLIRAQVPAGTRVAAAKP